MTANRPYGYDANYQTAGQTHFALRRSHTERPLPTRPSFRVTGMANKSPHRRGAITTYSRTTANGATSRGRQTPTMTICRNRRRYKRTINGRATTRQMTVNMN